jgi:hypothetical protein
LLLPLPLPPIPVAEAAAQQLYAAGHAVVLCHE